LSLSIVIYEQPITISCLSGYHFMINPRCTFCFEVWYPISYWSVYHA